jgi:hypothetical protein
MENFFKKSIKKLATGAAFIGAMAGSPEKADAQKIKENFKYFENEKDYKKALKKYNDSLSAYKEGEYWKNILKKDNPFDKFSTTKKEPEMWRGDNKSQYIKTKMNPYKYLIDERGSGLSYIFKKPTYVPKIKEVEEIRKEIEQKITEKEIPVYHTSDQNDPRIQAYKDSMELYKNHPNTKIDLDINSNKAKEMTNLFYDNDSNKPIGYSSEKTGIKTWYTPVYKKPVQEVVLDELPKGPLKYATIDKAGQKYFFMTDSAGGTVHSVTERAYNEEYKNLPEIKYEDLKRFQEGK